jgi:hypothetical protein
VTGNFDEIVFSSMTGFKEMKHFEISDLMKDAVINPTGTVPEPSTWAMMLLGIAGLGFAGYRRARLAA